LTEDPMTADAFERLAELDRTNWPEVRDQILQFDAHAAEIEPRTYPGYPRWSLARVKPRLWPSLDHVLRARRSVRALATGLTTQRRLSRLLAFSHGVHAPGFRGPVPSGGGLQALEL
jgi:hypothetical protein